jgi:hypothetical protein
MSVPPEGCWPLLPSGTEPRSQGEGGVEERFCLLGEGLLSPRPH